MCHSSRYPVSTHLNMPALNSVAVSRTGLYRLYDLKIPSLMTAPQRAAAYCTSHTALHATARASAHILQTPSCTPTCRFGMQAPLHCPVPGSPPGKQWAVHGPGRPGVHQKAGLVSMGREVGWCPGADGWRPLQSSCRPCTASKAALAQQVSAQTRGLFRRSGHCPRHASQVHGCFQFVAVPMASMCAGARHAASSAALDTVLDTHRKCTEVVSL